MLPEEKFSGPQLEQKDAPDEHSDGGDALVRTVKGLRLLRASCRLRGQWATVSQMLAEALVSETDNI